MSAKVVSVNISDKKGVKKKAVFKILLKRDSGIEGDAHASSKWHRQISLLGIESIGKMKSLGLKVGPGDFAENITTDGIDLLNLPIGTRLLIGESAEVEVSQHGKTCHERCAIYTQAGDCVMPKEGIFAKVIKGGVVRKGDEIKVVR